MQGQSVPCEMCGQPIKRHATRFCSPRCRGLAWRASPPDFWQKVEKTAGCWLWSGYIDKYGYGQLTAGQRRYRAHRIAFELTRGPIPPGLFVCHACDTNYSAGDTTYRRCVNPDHLYLDSLAGNMAHAREIGRLATGDRNGFRRVGGRCGEANPMHRLTAEDVHAIRTRYAAGGISQAQLTREYGLRRGTIGAIVRRENWQHLP